MGETPDPDFSFDLLYLKKQNHGHIDFFVKLIQNRL